jgi:hypothetical protein
MRKTPAVAQQVIVPYLQSSARFQARLIDFDTGSSALTDQHKAWLRQSMNLAKLNSMYRIRLVGYASKLDDAAKNSKLSYNRIDTALKFVQTVDHYAMDRTETFRAVGEDAYFAAPDDNSPEYRAVEAHIFIGDLPPPPPAQVTPQPHELPPMPGGPRYTQWQIASPGGVFVSAGFGAGFNIFVIQNVKTTEIRAYIQPIGGYGASLNLPGLDVLGQIVKSVLGGTQYGDMSYTKVTSKLPVTWAELEHCLVRVSSVSGGLGRGYAYAIITFTAAAVFQRNSNGYPLKLPGGDLFQFTAKGKDWQIGFGASVAVGPLKRVDDF